MPYHQPRALIIIPNYNQRPLLEVCLASLRDNHILGSHAQAVVVDDASSDDSVQWLREQNPDVICQAQTHNTGFAGACNAGLRYALGHGFDYAALLNNDTRVDAHWLSALLDAAAADDAVGVVGSKIKSWDGALVEYAGNVFNVTAAAGGYLDTPDDGSYDSVHPAGYACGAAALYRMDCLRQIGLLDEQYFMYNEDVDISVRAWVAGWKVMFTPHSVIYHMRGKSTTGNSTSHRLGARNALTTVLKNYQRSTLRHYKREIYSNFFTPRAPVWCKQATLYNLLHLLPILARRRRIQALRRMNDVEWLRQVPFQMQWYAQGVRTFVPRAQPSEEHKV